LEGGKKKQKKEKGKKGRTDRKSCKPQKRKGRGTSPGLTGYHGGKKGGGHAVQESGNPKLDDGVYEQHRKEPVGTGKKKKRLNRRTLLRFSPGKDAYILPGGTPSQARQQKKKPPEKQTAKLIAGGRGA